MSPIHERTRGIDRTHIISIKKQMNGTYDRFVQEGFAFFAHGDEEVSKITPFSEIPEGVWKNAGKENGDWHILLPLVGSNESRDLFFRNSKLDGRHMRGGSEGAIYRGKHSSHTKGAGYKARSAKYDPLNVSKNR